MRPTRRPGPRCSLHGSLLALLALICQALFAPVLVTPVLVTPILVTPVLVTSTPPTALVVLAEIPLCHAGGADEIGGADETGGGRPAPQHRHHLPCALCPACHALGAVAMLPTPTPAGVVPPALLAALPSPPPPARAPPTAVIFAATFPTGPPQSSPTRA